MTYMEQEPEQYEDRASIEAQLREADESLKKPFLKMAQLKKGESLEIKMVGPRYGKPEKEPWVKDKDMMTRDQLNALGTYYIFDFKVLKSGSEFIQSGLTYEYACPKTYYKDGTKETETGEMRTIKGLRSMFMEGHRTFRITKVHDGKSTQFRNYAFTPIDKPNPDLSYSSGISRI